MASRTTKYSWSKPGDYNEYRDGYVERMVKRGRIDPEEILKKFKSLVGNLDTRSRELIDEYNSRLGKTGYVNDSDVWSKSVLDRDAEFQSIYKQAEEYADIYKSILGDQSEIFKGLKNQLGDVSAIKSYADDQRNYWSQWKDEGEYNEYKKQEKIREEYRKYDAKSGQADIAALEADIQKYNSLRSKLGTDGMTPADEAQLRTLYYDLARKWGGGTSSASPTAGKVNDSYWDTKKSAPSYVQDVADLDKLLSEKREYHQLATDWQNDEAFYYKALPEDKDKYISIGKNADVKSVGKSTTTTIGVGGMGIASEENDILRDAAVALAIHNGKSNQTGQSHTAVVNRFLDQMNDEEFDRLAYYIGKDQVEGTDEAYKYIKALDKQLNYRKGTEIAQKVEGKPILQRASGFVAGLDQFGQGINSLTSKEAKNPSAWQYAGETINESLADSGIKFKNGTSSGQLAYQFNAIVGNMLPSILTSAAIGMVSKTAGTASAAKAIGTAGKAIGAAVLGASAGGNAKQEMLNLGYDIKQARAYGTLVGASEAGLSYLVSGIPGLRGSDGVFSALGEKVLTKIDNALARVAITVGANAADEALEEAAQSVLEPCFESLVTGVDFEAPDIDEVLYSSLMGALTSVGLGGGSMAISGAASGVSNTVNDIKVGNQIKKAGNAAAVIERGASLNDTKAQDIASKIQKSDRVSSMKLGKLQRNISDSQMVASFNEKLGDGSRKISEALTNIVKGREVSDVAIKKVVENETARGLLNEALGTSIGAENSVSDARKAIDKVFESAIDQSAAEGKIDRDRVVKSLAVNLELSEAETFADTIEAIANGETVSDKKIEAVLKNKFARNALNKYTERTVENKFTANSTVNDVRAAMVEGDYSAKGQAVMYGAALGMSEGGIKGLVSIASGSKDIAKTAQAYNAVYQAAKQGKAITDVKSDLSPIEKDIAYEYGVMDSLVKKNETIDTEWDAEPEKPIEAKPMRKDVERTELQEVSDKSFYLKDKNGNDAERITPVKQETQEQVKLKGVGKKLGVDVIFADINKGGENIDGLRVGSTIYINPNNTSGNTDYVTFKHEFTHVIENTDGFRKFIPTVTDSKVFQEWRSKQGFSTSQAYIEQLTANYKQVGKNLDPQAAQGEMVANFVGDVLFDGDVDKFVSDMTAEQKTTFKSLIRAAIDWIKQKLGKTSEVEMLEKKYAEVFREANKNELKAEKYVEETKDTQYNYTFAKEHKERLESKFTASSAVSLETLTERYDKVLEIWNRLGGQLNSKFMNEWNSKQGKDRAFTVFKAQSGYKYNVELSSMCNKGVPLFEAIDTIVKEEAMKELNVKTLGKAEKEILYDLLKSDGFDIPCAICYVEQARQREGAIIDAFLHGTEDGKVGWNTLLREVEEKMHTLGVDYKFPALDRSIATDKYVARKLTMTEAEQDAFYKALKEIANREITKYNEANKKSRKLVTSLTPAAIADCFKGNISSDIKIFKVLFQNPDSRFTIESDLLYSSTATHNLAYAHQNLYSLFNQQGGVSGYKTKQGNVVYWGDILDKKWEASKLRKEGGIRYQSNSDSQMYTLLDQVQMFIDLTAKGYYLQSYSKVLSYLKLLGLSKGKINASLIPKVAVYYDANGDVDWAKTTENAGLDENGNPIYDDVEGINHKEAFMLIEDADYSKSIGGVCIGYSDKHIMKLLDDSRVQLIIGFHDKTNNPDKRYRGARYAKNYNGINEAVDSEGKTVHIGFNQFVQQAEKMFAKDGESFTGTATHNGKEYTANDIPRLAADIYLEHCEKKGYSPAYNIEGIVDHPNYYKLLADFSLYDSKGNYAPHQKVEYNMPDQVPYLDEKGRKRYMKSETYIRTELEKELKVRDDIAAKLADKSEAGLIPRFIKAVNGKNTLDNSNDAEYNEDTSYSYTPKKKDWGNGSDYLIRNFIGKINFSYSDFYISDQELAIISHSIKTGWGVLSSSKTIGRVYTSEAYYVFKLETNGAISIQNVYDLGTSDRIIDYLEETFKNDRTGLETIGTLNGWFDIVRNGERRYSDVSRSDVQQTEQGRTVDEMDGRSSTSNTGTDRDAGAQSGSKDDIDYSYTPKREEQLEEWMAQFKSGAISDEEFKRNVMRVKPQTDPLSLAHITEADVMEMANTTPNIKKKTGENNVDGERNTIISNGRSSIFNEAFKKEVETDEFIQKYATITNEDTLKTAAKELDAGGHDGVQEWLSLPPERASTVDIVKGFILLDRYQRAGNAEGAARVAQKVSEMGTAAGQSVQAFTILRRMTPETMMVYAQKSLDRVHKEFVEKRGEAWMKKHGDKLKLNEEDIEYIFNRVVVASAMPDGRTKDVMLAQIASRLQDKIPPEKGQGVKAAQRISMLLNPKTLGRNILGNVTITPIHWISDWIGTPVDKIVSVKTGMRTKSAISNAKEDIKAFGRGAYESYEDFVKKINTQVDLDRFDISKAHGKSFYEGGKLAGVAKMANALDRFTSFALAAGDRPFYEYWFTRSLNSQMKANKVSTPAEDMLTLANLEALERTWQDTNGFTQLATGLKRALNTANIGGYGLGDVLIKFTKTPANLAKAIYDFSPAGFATATRDAVRLNQAVKSGKGVAMAQRQFVKSISNALAGTMLYVAAYALFKAGRLSGASDDDKDVAAFEKWVQGIPAYSFKAFGKWYSYEWMQPIGSVAAIMSDYMESKDAGSGKWDSIVLALKSGGNVLYNQSFLQSFQKLFTADNFWEGLQDAILSDPSAFVPQILSQTASVFDEDRRVTYDAQSPIKSVINSIAYKIPGLRNTLTEDVDVFGRVVPNSQSNVYDAFLNPSNTYVDTSDAVTDHVYGLYKELGSKGMIPDKAPYSITAGGKKYVFSAEERAEYQKIMGSVSYKIIEKLLESDVYNSYTPSEQEVVIKAVYSYAEKTAQASVNVEVTYDMLHDYDDYLTRDKYAKMSDEEKREAYRNGILKDYVSILNTDESGVVAFFANKGVRAATIDAVNAGDVSRALELIEEAKTNVARYNTDKDAPSDFVATIKSGITSNLKQTYKVAYYTNDSKTMSEVESTLIGLGMYGRTYDVRKLLKSWINE